MADMEKKKTRIVRSEVFMLLFELVAFLFVMVLALHATVARLFGHLPVQGTDTISVWVLLTAFSAMTAALVLLLKSSRGTQIFSALFAFSVFMGIGTALTSLFGTSLAVIGVSAAILLYYSDPPVIVFDVILATGLAGVASVVGISFSPLALVGALLALAVYDVVAVYVTKHMVKMAKTLLQRKVFFAMIVPTGIRSFGTRISKTVQEKFAFMGTGDIVLPALLVSSVTPRSGVMATVPIIIGTLLGVTATHALFLLGKRRPLPALPPIAVGASVGFLISSLIH